MALSVVPLDDESGVVARALVAEYGDSLKVDLSFQDFHSEVRNFPGEYRPPLGAFFVARDAVGELAGCVGLRPIAGAGCCEMKRLYVRDAYRGRGAGQLLASAVVADARSRGYKAMRLETLGTMRAAHGLYRRLGFVEIPNYNTNPLPGIVFFELDLTAGF